MDGLRTSRTDGTKTYSYVYNGGTLNFTYDASGRPLSVTLNGTTYYYVTNLQGDVTAILNSSGTAVVNYTYDAWGNPLATSGDLATTLGTLNPLRYRGYVYDTETELYYLQSRYYDPQIGRFLNADALVATGQGLLGNNMIAYCGNNPVNYTDPNGKEPISVSISVVILGVVICVLLVDLGARSLADLIEWISIQWQYAYARIQFVSEEKEVEAEEGSNSTKQNDKKRSLEPTGPPNSDAELYDENGNLKQQRHYGPDGRAEYDIDYRHAGDYEFPHRHTWDWNVVPPRSGHIPFS